jgi:hypothetical protein
VTDATEHLSPWTLEQLAEDDLPHRERTLAEAHLRSCAPCAGELERARAVLAALATLPALSPSTGFVDAVMARVRIVPKVVAVPLAVEAPARRRWLPATLRGWLGLTAVLAFVMTPFALLGAFLAAHPTVSVGAAWPVARGWLVDTAWNGVVSLAGALARSGAYVGMADLVAAVPGPHALGIPVLLLVAGAAIPLATYALVRLLSTPMMGMTHAH